MVKTMFFSWFCHNNHVFLHGFATITMVSSWFCHNNHGFHGFTIKFTIKPWLSHDYHGKNHGFFMGLPQ